MIILKIIICAWCLFGAVMYLRYYVDLGRHMGTSLFNNVFGLIGAMLMGPIPLFMTVDEEDPEDEMEP